MESTPRAASKPASRHISKLPLSCMESSTGLAIAGINLFAWRIIKAGKLITYYAKFGFLDEGVSDKSTHGNVVWNQMRRSF